MNFPVFKTKTPGVNKKFDLNNPEERKEYFEAKAGKEIAALKKYLEKNTFIAYLLGKKNSGKGTYSKMFGEVVGQNKVAHLSVGDMVRRIDSELKDKNKKKELYEFLEKNYRGWVPLKDIIASLEKRSTKTLLPTELVLALVKREIAKMPKKAIFIDGFPREMDQISYSLFFRDLVDYRQDPDVFILIDVPTAVIDERIKFRRICPLCQTSRNIKLFPTSRVQYDEKKKKFELFCDNSNCQGAIMVSKEGDEFGTKPIKNRLKLDEKLINMAFNLHGIPKVLLRNSIPVKDVKKFADDYEITPEYVFQWDKNKKEVKVLEKPWIIKDDAKVSSVSLLAAPVALSMVRQLAKVLELA
jgi:adenylate kinase family enzyme